MPSDAAEWREAMEAVEARRRDPAFRARLDRIMEEHKLVLDKLAESERQDLVAEVIDYRAQLAVLLSLLGLPPGEGLAAAVDRVRELLAAGDELAGKCHGKWRQDCEYAERWREVRGEATDTEEAGTT